MADFIPTDMTNRELFKKVYPSHGFFLYHYENWANICNTEESRWALFCTKKGNNDLGLFLDCLYRMEIQVTTIRQTWELSDMFFLAKRYVLDGRLDKEEDVSRAVEKLFLHREKDTVNIATFIQQGAFLSYFLIAKTEKLSIEQQDDGKMVLKKKISFREPRCIS